MRIVIVAENASTRFGGEAFLPFHYFRVLRARQMDVRLIVHGRNRSELLEEFPNDVDRLCFVEDTTLHKVLSRIGSFLPGRLAESTTGFFIQVTTQFAQRRIVKRIERTLGLDIVHQPIPVSPKAPSMMFGIGAAVVIGPLNGAMDYPPAFRRDRGMLSNVGLRLARDFANCLNLILPGKRWAKLVLVANNRTRHALPNSVQGRIVEVVENGVDFSVWNGAPDRKVRHEDKTVRFIFVGRLIDLKAIDIILEAMRRIRFEIAVSLEIIGEGPMKKVWETQAQQMGLGDIVIFSGWMSQQDCAIRLRQADVFLMPSLHDCGGAVVLEAMATGKPVIATAWGGPIDYLDDSCGVLVSPDSREALIAGFAENMKILALAPDLRDRLGQAGLQKVRLHFDWERKVDLILDLYRAARTVAGAR
jgi:glycosyltransferase involved in cell wall biosynthesis